MTPPLETLVDGRRVTVLAPDVVDSSTPLLLCHDGQNVLGGEHALSGAGWRLDEAIALLAASRGLPEPVVVAPWSSPDTRWAEYAPQAVLEADQGIRRGFVEWYDDQPLHGDAYADWCAGVLLPWAATAYGLDLQPASTAVMGSSMGGLASLYALARHPDVYGTALSLSTHWTPGGPGLPRLLVEALPKPGSHRVWLDHGSLGLDAAYGPHQETAVSPLLRLGWTLGRDLEAREYPGTDHDERAWAARVPEALGFWLAH